MLNIFALSKIHELPTNGNEIPSADGGEDYDVLRAFRRR